MRRRGLRRRPVTCRPPSVGNAAATSSGSSGRCNASPMSRLLSCAAPVGVSLACGISGGAASNSSVRRGSSMGTRRARGRWRSWTCRSVLWCTTCGRSSGRTTLHRWRWGARGRWRAQCRCGGAAACGIDARWRLLVPPFFADAAPDGGGRPALPLWPCRWPRAPAGHDAGSLPKASGPCGWCRGPCRWRHELLWSPALRPGAAWRSAGRCLRRRRRRRWRRQYCARARGGNPSYLRPSWPRESANPISEDLLLATDSDFCTCIP